MGLKWRRGTCGGVEWCCWLVPQNPLGDAVVERCLEVVGRYNSSLEQLDLHGTSVSRQALEMASALTRPPHAGWEWLSVVVVVCCTPD